MDDTRLVTAKSDASDALIALYAIFRERQGDSSEAGVKLRKAFNAAREAFELIVDLMAPDFPICGSYHSLGAKCYRHGEHEGVHVSDLGLTWTDDSSRRAGDAIANSFGAGARD